MPENTISAQFRPEGEENLVSALKAIQSEMAAAQSIVTSLGQAFGKEDAEIEKVVKSIFSLNNAVKLFNQYQAQLDKEMRDNLAAMSRQDAEAQKLAKSLEKQAEANRKLTASIQSGALKELSAIERQIQKEVDAAWRSIEKQTSAIQKQAAAAEQAAASLKKLITTTDATALGRFNSGLVGGAEKLAQFETNAYNASKMSTFFSQQLFTHPIQTLTQFAGSAEKAAIAGQYFREQLAFIAASRFGTIILWGTIIAGIAEAMKFVASSAIDLEKNVHFVQSAFVGTEKDLKEYAEVQDKIIQGSVAFGQNFETVSKILWELKSAGLAVADAYAGLEINQRLVAAGVSNIDQSVRLTAGIFRVYGDSIQGAVTAQQKFATIGDTLAYVLNKSQADMDGLIQGFKYVMSSSELADVSFNQVAASLSVLNNRMLFGSTAGSSLVNAFVQFAKNQDKIVSAFDLQIDKSKTFGQQFESILTQLHDRFGETAMSLEQMSDLFEGLNLRGGRAIAALIKGYKEWKGTLDELNLGKVKGDLQEISDVRMDTLVAQWGRFKESLAAAGAEAAAGPNLISKYLLKSAADAMELHRRFSDITGDMALIGGSADTLRQSMDKSNFKQWLEDVTGDSKTLLGVLQQYPTELIVALNTKDFKEGIKDVTDLRTKLAELTQDSIREASAGDKMRSIWASQQETTKAIVVTWDDFIAKQTDLNGLRKIGLITLEEEAKILETRIVKKQQEIADSLSKQSNAWKEQTDDLIKLEQHLNQIKIIQEKNVTSAAELATALGRVGETAPERKIAQLEIALKGAQEILLKTPTDTAEWGIAVDKVKQNFVAIRNELDVSTKKIEQMKVLQEANTKATNDLQAAMKRVGDVTLAEKMVQLETSLTGAYQVMRATSPETDKWHTSAEKVASVFREIQTTLDQGIKQAMQTMLSDLSKADSAATNYFSELSNKGQLFKGADVYSDMLKKAEEAVRLTTGRVDEQAAAYEHLIAVQKEGLKWGFERPIFMNDTILEESKKILELRTQIAKKDIGNLTDAQNQGWQLENARNKIADNLRFMSSDEGMSKLNTALSTTVTLTQRVSDNLEAAGKKIADTLTGIDGIWQQIEKKIDSQLTADARGAY